ncbi:MAG: type I glyceraldehyde-3-phosphate dehydrogenase [Candidatus Reconcilbacillus cellulovorans]|uniref:Type I glyceraldehyde-3-phosphate dehydrogenase n=1 Tax=Candidatus Reconcilbacillus cellulovorans TaxID=1906605 RepID=A0A2A6DZM7_9BACL|nr:MAG: type I glyceraldehyde-3-phosphate dehydrogenase [Candidatus Reconcilbacillus cellulovorans]
METAVGINGMGRIGRLIFRRAFGPDAPDGLRVTAVNSIHPAETVAHLLKYDSVHGTWGADVRTDGPNLVVDGRPVRVFNRQNPAEIEWSEAGVDIVIEATGKFLDRNAVSSHLRSGVSRVVVTAPGKSLDLTVVMGVNETAYDPSRHVLLSASSCTTTCAATVLAVLDRAFGVRGAWVTTVHSYTSDQRHLDNPHKDLRRARACTLSIVPTSTGIGRSLADVLPHLASSVRGIAVRVPTPDVSLVDMTVTLTHVVDADDIRAAFREASGGRWSRYVGYTDLPLVSADFIGNDKSAVIDGASVETVGDQAKILAWYDNEWGYACRVLDLVRYISDLQPERRECACTSGSSNSEH